MNQDIFIVIEHLRRKVSDISYMMLAAAHDLAHDTGGKIVAVLLGHNAQELVHNLKTDQVLYSDHPSLADFNPEAYQKALTGIIDEYKPKAVLLDLNTYLALTDIQEDIIQPGYIDSLYKELADLTGIIRVLNYECIINEENISEDTIASKEQAIYKYMQISKSLGILK